MTNGTVVRSMVLNDGYVIALDDGLISWRPSGGRRTNLPVTKSRINFARDGGTNWEM